MSVSIPYFRISCILCWLLASGICRAQQEDYFNTAPASGSRRTFYNGVAAGINASQVDGDNYAGFHKAGLNIGFVSYARLNETFRLSIEMLYSRKGARNVQVINSPAVGSVPEIYTLKLNYAEIPLMLHIYTGYNIHLGMGLSYSRLLSSKESLESSVPVNLHPEVNTFHKDDINYLASIQYQLYKGISVRARYQYSARSIRDADKIPEALGTAAQYNNLFALQLVCLF